MFSFGNSRILFATFFWLSACASLGSGDRLIISEGFHHLAHDLYSGQISILNEKQIYIENLIYDGKGPAAWFAVGSRGSDYKKERVDMQNITLIPDENYSCGVLQPYDGTKSITLTLPGDLKVTDITFLVIFCIEYNHNFGYVEIPRNLEYYALEPDNSLVPRLNSCPRKYYGKGGKMPHPVTHLIDPAAPPPPAYEETNEQTAASYLQENYAYYYVPVASYLLNNFANTVFFQ